jgi:hypothetical protein
MKRKAASTTRIIVKEFSRAGRAMFLTTIESIIATIKTPLLRYRSISTKFGDMRLTEAGRKIVERSQKIDTTITKVAIRDAMDLNSSRLEITMRIVIAARSWTDDSLSASWQHKRRRRLRDAVFREPF